MKKLATFTALWFCFAWLTATPALAQEEPESAPQDEQTDDAEAAESGEDEGVGEEESPPEPEEELDCTNQVDDDDDGDVDCDDYDCFEDEACYEEEEEDDTVEDTDDGEDEPVVDIGTGDDEEEEDDLIDIPEDEEEEDGSDDWNDRPVDIFELHGYLRLRGDIFHQLHMARVSGGPPNYYENRVDPDDPLTTNYYHPRPAGSSADVACGQEEHCSSNTFAGANMRFRFEPVINVGDQIRILGQIDLLDNLVLGSTPEGSSIPGGSAISTGWAPLRAFSTTQEAPNGRNSLADAISVRRLWAEVTTPLGQLHFGRMGSHWGLGMLQNSGNLLDDDYGVTVDRISLAARLWGILLVPGVEFVSSGPTTQMWNEFQGQPLDAAQLDDVMQYFIIIARQLDREEQAERIRRGNLVLNGGIHFTFRNQVLTQEDPYGAPDTWVDRNAWAVVPDLWFQLYYRGFHLELEFAYIAGDVENRELDGYDSSTGTDLRQFGGVVRADYTALNDQLNVGIEFGYASGDPEIEGLSPYQAGRLRQQSGYSGSSVDSLFRFNPDFNVDLILFEQVLGQVSGAYYFRPWVEYEFIRHTLGVRADVIYSLASEPMQTIGNSPHLGVEIDAAIWFRGRPPFNFTAMLQYGVLFPLSGWKDPFYEYFDGLEYPQTVQVLMAVHY